MTDPTLEALLGKTVKKLFLAFDYAKIKLSRIQAGEPSADFFADLVIDYHGAPMPLKAVGSLTVTLQKPASLLIHSWEGRALLDKVAQAIKGEKNAELVPQYDSKEGPIRVTFPQPSRERREELVNKDVKRIGEETLIAYRSIRKEFKSEVKKLIKQENLSEDVLGLYEKKLDKEIEAYKGQLQDYLKKKEEQLLKI